MDLNTPGCENILVTTFEKQVHGKHYMYNPRNLVQYINMHPLSQQLE